jgi:hypothetical protein
MRKPIVVRPFTATEQHALQEGVRSSDAFVLRRCQLLLASARGQHARAIAATLGGDDQPVRKAIHAFNVRGLAAGRRRSSAPPQTPPAVFTSARREQVRAMLHQSPRTFDTPTSLWTLDLAADVAYALGITPRRVSGETIRHALAALQTRWKRAKPWITSPDPASARGKPSATG